MAQKKKKMSNKKTARTKSRSFAQNKFVFNYKKAALFAAIFGLIGGYFIWKSFAATAYILKVSDINASLSSNITFVKETTSTNKRNTSVVQIASSGKAVFRNSTNYNLGGYSVCIYARVPSGSTQLSVNVKTVNTGVSLGTKSITLNGSNQYNKLACQSILLTSANDQKIQVTVNNSGSTARLASVIFEQTSPPLPDGAQGYGPGGTYSDWYFPNGQYQSLEWIFLPVKDPPVSLTQDGLLHYYAYNFYLVNSTSSVGGGYAGFQTNGIFLGQQKGKVVNFSIWGSNGGKSSTGWVNPGNQESGGYQIMAPYPWVEGRQYRFQLKAGTSGSDSQGKWWGLWVTDLSAQKTTYIGEQRVPSTINGNPSTAWSSHTSMFGEDLHWWRSINGDVKYNCSDFQASSMAALGITANQTVKPTSVDSHTNSGQLNTGSNGFVTVNCKVTIYSGSQFSVQHNLGYWPQAAPNNL